jgi:hypothetical protein
MGISELLLTRNHQYKLYHPCKTSVFFGKKSKHLNFAADERNQAWIGKERKRQFCLIWHPPRAKCMEVAAGGRPVRPALFGFSVGIALGLPGRWLLANHNLCICFF